jgi:hypothetical protein
MTDCREITVKTKKKRSWAVLGFGCGCLFLIVLLAVGLLLYAGWQGYKESPMMVEVQNYAAQLEDPYTLSPDQTDQLFSYGYPEAFTILFYEEETLSGGTETVRLEVWDYYSQAVGLTFINGELTAEDPIEMDDLGTLEPLPYYPEQFSAFMSLDEVVAAAGIDSYAEIPLEKEFLKDGVVYYASALTFGMVDGELRYIEALALSD